MPFQAQIESEAFLSIEQSEDGFHMKWEHVEGGIKMAFEDVMMSEWLDDPIAFGAFEDEKLLGFAEGFLETWNNRYRIANICVFDLEKRRHGVGTALLNRIEREAVKRGARMIVLETQSYNSKALSFYRKNGYEIIGFDRYAYANDGPERHNMRIEMGKKVK